jgi:hypothetical protein
MPKALLQRFLLAVLHVLAGWSLTVFSLAYLAPWTGLALLPAVITLFVSVPVALVGILNFYFGGYGRIPEVTWVILSMLLGAGLIFLTSMFFV